MFVGKKTNIKKNKFIHKYNEKNQQYVQLNITKSLSPYT